MATPKTVTLFLMDGVPSGRIKCSLTNWIGQVYLIPRTALSDSKDRPELNQTGVYILLGTDDETGEEKAYIGQAIERKNGNGVLGRIVEHIGEERQDYFTHAIAIITSNNSFGPTEISYLENSLYQMAVSAGRVHTTNSNEPSVGKVTEEKQAELDEFIGFTKIAVRSMGYKLFDEVNEAKSSASILNSSPEDVEPLLFLNAAGASGNGRQTADGFVVLKGAKLRMSMTPSAPDSTRANRARYVDRVSSTGELLQDTLFNSPSAASSFLTGSSTSGKALWNTESGVSLGELERQDLELGSATGS